MIDERESAALEEHLGSRSLPATSRIALVEVLRATAIANPAQQVAEDTARLLGACLLVDVGTRVLRAAAGIASREIRTLDAIHLASALYIDVDEFVAYDRRLLDAAAARGLRTASPGWG